MTLEESLLGRERVQVVRVVLDVAVGGHEETGGACGGVLHDLAGLRLHHAHDAVDERARREILARARFLLGGVFFQQPLIEIAQALLAGREPIELVDAAGQSLQVRGLAQPRLGIGEDGADQGVLGGRRAQPAAQSR